ncbi:hypothetical protein T484DRAFT_1931830 [Baffinella frigidus]|nr:hypothetical protein T484DRAFT_1931830 [Cryptophyta sp. CCMP2293]
MPLEKGASPRVQGGAGHWSQPGSMDPSPRVYQNGSKGDPMAQRARPHSPLMTSSARLHSGMVVPQMPHGFSGPGAIIGSPPVSHRSAAL